MDRERKKQIIENMDDLTRVRYNTSLIVNTIREESIFTNGLICMAIAFVIAIGANVIKYTSTLTTKIMFVIVSSYFILVSILFLLGHVALVRSRLKKEDKFLEDRLYLLNKKRK